MADTGVCLLTNPESPPPLFIPATATDHPSLSLIMVKDFRRAFYD